MTAYAIHYTFQNGNRVYDMYEIVYQYEEFDHEDAELWCRLRGVDYSYTRRIG